MFFVGQCVIVGRRPYELLRWTTSGELLVRDTITSEKRWVDYYQARVIDPHTDGGALLDALSVLRSEDSMDDDCGPSSLKGDHHEQHEGA